MKRLCLALDVPSSAEAVEWVRRTEGGFGVYKIGLQLFCAEGPSVVDRVREAGAPAIFLDLKLHDIPNTVAGAAASVGGLGVDYLTVHTGGGGAMIRAAVEAAPKVGILGVTVLTSLQAAPGEVLERARLATQSGCAGIVCSPLEVAELRDALGHEAVLVTPGIRAASAMGDDQTRVATAGAALTAGASLLVIGRMVRGAADPAAAVRALHAEIEGV